MYLGDLNITKLLILIIIETEEKEIEVLTKLKETVDKQRDEVRKQKRELSQKNVDCEAVGILKREIN